MYGRTATARSAARATDTATINLRRRMALAVARRFGSAGRPVTQPPAPPQPIVVRADGRDDADNGILALDQRVRQTGEW